MTCASMAYDGSGDATDGASAGDQYVFTQYTMRQRGMHSITERIEDRRDIQINVWIMMPEIAHRH